MNLRHSRMRVRVPHPRGLRRRGRPVVPMAQSASALVPTAFDKAMWGVDGRVRKIVQTDTAIYLGGTFSNLLGPNGEIVPRTNLAALDPVTGAPLPFAPTRTRRSGRWRSPGWVLALPGWRLHQVNGVNRKRLAKVDATTGALASWRVDANNQVQAIATRDDLVYVGVSSACSGPLRGPGSPLWTPPLAP